jgi:hypothetical protein
MKKNEFILCECGCDEHQMIFKYDDDPDWDNVFVSYHLPTQPFWRRLVTGIKYILGKKSRYGHWGEIILDGDETTIERFENVVDALKVIQRNQKLKNEIHGNKAG